MPKQMTKATCKAVGVANSSGKCCSSCVGYLLRRLLVDCCMILSRTSFRALSSAITEGYSSPAVADPDCLASHCAFCFQLTARFRVTSRQGQWLPICRLCWHCLHARLLCRYLPSHHYLLQEVNAALDDCVLALVESKSSPSVEYPDFSATGLPRMVFPDEHLDGGPLPGPSYFVADPPDAAPYTAEPELSNTSSLTPRSDSDCEFWQ